PVRLDPELRATVESPRQRRADLDERGHPGWPDQDGNRTDGTEKGREARAQVEGDGGQRRESINFSMRRWRVSWVFASAIELTCLRRSPNGRRSNAARSDGFASSAMARSVGSATTRGSVSSSRVTSISSPRAIFAAARLAALMPTRNRPFIDAIRLRQL